MHDAVDVVGLAKGPQAPEYLPLVFLFKEKYRDKYKQSDLGILLYCSRPLSDARPNNQLCGMTL